MKVLIILKMVYKFDVITIKIIEGCLCVCAHMCLRGGKEQAESKMYLWMK